MALPRFAKEENTRKLLKKMVITMILSSVILSVPEVMSGKPAIGPESDQTLVLETDTEEVEDICSLADVICQSEKAVATPQKSNEAKRPLVVSGKRPIKKGASERVQEKIDYAWSISKNIDFIYTLEVENAGSWDVNKLSDIVGANGYRDKGICQFNIGYHPKIVNDKRFQDYKWQIDRCWEHYKKGTRFYGYDVRHRAINRFEIASN